MQWLKKQINSEITATHTVTFDCTIQKNPLKRAKSLVITSKTVITHICDYESNKPMHTKTNVKEAIARSKNIMQRNAENGSTLSQYKTYKYYKENPALTIWESIEKIFKDCGLL